MAPHINFDRICAVKARSIVKPSDARFVIFKLSHYRQPSEDAVSTDLRPGSPDRASLRSG
jgi:hypothetical protein